MPQPLPRIAVAPAENRPYRVAMPRTSKRPLPRHVLRIGERRRELGLTPEELARMAGFSTSLMAKIERGAVDPKTLSAQYLVGLARALGLTLSEVMGEEVPGDDLGFVPFTLPVYTSPEELEEGKLASRAFLAPAELPRGAVVERLAFLEVPGRWLATLDLPFPTARRVWVLTELRPLLQPQAVYLGKAQGYAAFFPHEALERDPLALYPLHPELPTLWLEEERPEVLGLVRGWRVL